MRNELLTFMFSSLFLPLVLGALFRSEEVFVQRSSIHVRSNQIDENRPVLETFSIFK